MSRASDFSAFDPLSRAGLALAWGRVRANDGCSGADGVTIEQFDRDVRLRLEYLARDLRSGAYRPDRLRHVSIPKPDGGVRVLAIPNLTDRVVQTAVAQHLSNRLDRRMSRGSFGYRPHRGVSHALGAFATARRRGLVWTFDADINAFFDEVPHALLMSDLSIWLDDPRLLGLIALWLKGFGERGRGLAQGSPISPLLSNLFLHPLDRGLERMGLPPVRYADDFVVPCANRYDAFAAGAATERLLRDRGLRLQSAKTFIQTPLNSFTFLGVVVPPARRQTATGGLR